MVTTIVVLIHALIGIAFISGLIGRWIVLGLAERATDVPTMKALTVAAGPFERIVIVGSIFVSLFGVAAAFVEDRSVLGPLTGGGVDWLFVSLLLFLSVLPLVPVVFIPRGKVFEAALLDAETEGHVTPKLIDAWRDPVVRAAHVYELGAITMVLILMLTKPF